MKKVEQAEDLADLGYMFARDNFGPVATAPPTPAAVNGRMTTVVLDASMAAIKWLFLYLPGATVIHMIMVGFGLLHHYDDIFFGMLVGTFGIYLVAVFMVMLGIGKLQQLRYLRVVGAMTLTSAIFGLAYLIASSLVPSDFFGSFLWWTLPITLTASYLVKRNLDQRPD